jgi:hypothetical protein
MSKAYYEKLLKALDELDAMYYVDDVSFLFEFLLALLKRMGMKKQYDLLKSWGDLICLRLKYWSFPAALKGIEELFGVKFDIPYFEPLDLTWYWKIPLSND